jgi:hypothetical protein
MVYPSNPKIPNKLKSNFALNTNTLCLIFHYKIFCKHKNLFSKNYCVFNFFFQGIHFFTCQTPLPSRNQIRRQNREASPRIYSRNRSSSRIRAWISGQSGFIVPSHQSSDQPVSRHQSQPPLPRKQQQQQRQQN